MKRWLSGILIGFFAFTSLAVILPSGLNYCTGEQCGTMFWGAHEHDGVWHLAVGQNLLSHFPFEMPNMAGVGLAGYNYLLDLGIALISYVTRISVSVIYFQLVPLLWFGLFVFSTLRFAMSYSKSKTFPIWLLFFNFLGSSFSYLLTLRNHGTIWGSSGLLAMQSMQNLLNVQFALSLIPLYALLTGLAQNKRNWSDYTKYGVYLFIMMGLKFYTGVAGGIILFVDWLLLSINSRKLVWEDLGKNILSAGLLFVSIGLFYAPGSGSGSPLTFSPMSTVKPIIEDSSLLQLPVRAQQLYTLHGVKLWSLELFVLILFIVMNYGSRILALLGYLGNNKLEKQRLRVIIALGAVTSFAFAVLFVQRGVWWNTVQFLYVSMFLSNILAAEGMVRMTRGKKILGVLGASLIVLLTIPTNLDIMRSFVRFPGSSYIPKSEIKALSFLSKQPEGVVLSQYLHPSRGDQSLPPLTEAYDTSYVTAYSGKSGYLNDLIQLDLTNIPYSDRLNLINAHDCMVLEEVDYVYELNNKPYSDQYHSCGRSLTEIFKNETVTIYKTN